MGESAAERRERLKALRAQAEEGEGGALGGGDGDRMEDGEGEKGGGEGAKLKFRNYVPKDAAIAGGEKAVPLAVGEGEKDDSAAADVDVEEEEEEEEEEELINITPAKANWDLKRDIEKKLEILDERTQKAIVYIMKEQEKAS